MAARKKIDQLEENLAAVKSRLEGVQQEEARVETKGLGVAGFNPAAEASLEYMERYGRERCVPREDEVCCVFALEGSTLGFG